MKTAYRVLAYLVALLVVVQAGAIAFATFGLGKWIEDGGVLDQATIEGRSAEFVGVIGYPIHGIVGQLVIPVLALILLIVSFFAKVPKGVMWAAVTFGLVVVQVLAGTFARGLPALGLLHGINALLLFGVAVMAAMAATSRNRGADAPERAAVA